MTNNRGSEWRKWDLHIHTPKSIVNNYGGDTLDIWEKYIDALEHLPQDVAVIGITDYYFIDGYEEVMKYKMNGRLKNLQKIFPILEFRIDTFGSGNENNLQKINLHILFDIDEQNLSNDIKKIRTEFIERIPITKLEEHKTKVLSIDNFIEIGGNVQAGFSSLIPPTDKVFDLLDSPTWKGKTFQFLGYKEWSNLEKNNQLKPFKQNLYRRVGAFFSSNYSSIEKNQGWLNEYGHKRLLHSLDIHDFSMLDTANKDANGNYIDSTKYCCNTWIKADTTFEGLKQILYEPEERVCVQNEKPGYKPTYQIIDSITLQEYEFWHDKVYLNDNLNTIIGGRSTGKSTLLSAVACKLGCYAKDEDNGQLDDPSFVEKHLDGVSIRWRDGKENVSRDVDYFPQSYMYKLSHDNKEFDAIISGHILGDDKSILNVYAEKNNQLQKDLHINILSLFQEQATYKSFISKLKEMGDKDSVQKEIGTIETKIKALIDKTQITESETDKYKSDVLKLSQNEQLIKTTTADIKNLEYIKNAPIFVIDYIERNCSTLSAVTKLRLTEAYSDITKKVGEQWLESIDCILCALREQLKQYNNENQAIKESDLYIKCERYYRDNKELDFLQRQLKEEQNKLHEIEQQEIKCKDCGKNIDSLVQNLVNRYAQFKENAEDVCKQVHIKHGDIKIVTIVSFKKEELSAFLKERFILKGSDRQGYVDRLVNEYDNKDTITNYIQKAINDELAYKSTHDSQSVMTELLSQNWYKYRFDVIYQGDRFSEMSPGKQAFVILKLLLDFSDKKCPILIDQPEDSLDNRAIYSDLVTYIKNKKKERQIILVTHNPNVVVSADAENVIVANQNGKNSPNANGVKFHYINGSLENSKEKDVSIESVLESQGIREHVCEILEGGKEAFEKREKKYGFR